MDLISGGGDEIDGDEYGEEESIDGGGYGV